MGRREEVKEKKGRGKEEEGRGEGVGENGWIWRMGR